MMRKGWFFLLILVVSLPLLCSRYPVFAVGSESEPAITAVPQRLLEMLPQTTDQLEKFAVSAGSECVGSCLSWTYVLAAPYPTLQDGLSLRYLKQLWNGQPTDFLEKLILTPDTYRVFADRWGKGSARTIYQIRSELLLETAWQESKTWALLPFEELEPRWKVIAVNGSSPLKIPFDPKQDPLTFYWKVSGLSGNNRSMAMPAVSNFDPNLMTSLALTGTTALVRRLAYAIEEHGPEYPAAQIAERINAADFTHISNEAPFYADCPPGIPLRREARFCSLLSYYDVLAGVGADLIELTGNHLLDWGYQPFLDTLTFYHEKGLFFYGGGENLIKGREPLLLEHHGNRIAILGCNAIGPENILATNELPGPAPCHLDWLTEKIAELKEQGWLIVVTFQHLEYDDYTVVPAQSHDFYAAAEAGAAIVSGSQAHVPQGFTFVGDSFIHFGLGNFLFDQTSQLERDSFVDRHYFYGGRYIGNTLETIRMDESMQSRFLNHTERSEFLQLILGTCSWTRVFQ